MTPIDLITFVVTMLFLVILIGKRIKDERQRRNHPEDEMADDAKMKRFLKQYHLENMHEEEIEVEEEQELKPLLPIPKITLIPSQESMDLYDKAKPAETPLSTAAEFPEEPRATGTSRVHALIKNMPSLQDAIILQTILGPPKV